MTAFSVLYHPDEPPAEVTTAEELDQLLHQVDADAIAEAIPTYVEITDPDQQRALHIGLGRPDKISSLTFYDTESVTTSITTLSPTETPSEEWAFDFGGTWTHAPRDSAIPTGDAIRSAREFLTTGQRPTNVEWQTPEYGDPSSPPQH
ncbi:hypothetical protein GCM10011581_20670 [Saccharopolyspora subtropica]|uniref:Immunity protein Imm1 n=1 Tax=Saccharopolyspora thermophila TaxID=89367 RepID=A0A917JRL3_9PSEU|nr:Imm1 family immunity protein [Saccharopolyspora subtropica]GGI83292.1 hypothetical protein GCM10011581_20670 [Saccharopolyspora subtropica]